jgi:hypothetical protein
MSQADLDVLERDVEAARNRLARDIDRWRDPAAMATFKHEAVSKATALKDELVHKASDAASGTAQRLWSDVKDRASANPGAVLAIGAGLAWYFARHPPISSILVGFGLTSLLRTDPWSGPSPMVERAADFAGTVNEWAETAREVAGTVSQKTRGMREEAGEEMSQAWSATSDAADQAYHIAERVFSDIETRDGFLLGAAALAIGVATLITIQR